MSSDRHSRIYFRWNSCVRIAIEFKFFDIICHVLLDTWLHRIICWFFSSVSFLERQIVNPSNLDKVEIKICCKVLIKAFYCPLYFSFKLSGQCFCNVWKSNTLYGVKVISHDKADHLDVVARRIDFTRNHSSTSDGKANLWKSWKRVVVKQCYITYWCLASYYNKKLKSSYLLESSLSSEIFFGVNVIAAVDDLRGDCLGDLDLIGRGIFSFCKDSNSKR